MTEDVEELRRHLRALATVNRQLYAQLAEAKASPPKANGGGGGSTTKPRLVRVAREAWRRTEPLLPARATEVVRREIRPRLLGTPTPVAGSGAKPTKGAEPTKPSSPPKSQTASKPRSATSDNPDATAVAWLEAISDRHRRPDLVRPPDGRLVLVEDGQARPVSSTVVAAGLIEELGFARDVTEDEVTLPEGPPVELVTGADDRPHLVIGGERRPVRGLPKVHGDARQALQRFPAGKPIDLGRANVARLDYERAAGRMGELTTRLPRPVAANGARVLRRARRLITRP